jgi:predicted permease
VKAWIAGILSKLRHRRTDADLRDELRAHLEMQEEDLARPGVPADEARRRARLEFGDPQAVVENVRDLEFLTMLESCYRDFILGLRGLRRNPIFFLTAVLTIGIGIGANTAVFSLLHGLLLRSLPVPDAGDLVRVELITADTTSPNRPIPYKMIQHLSRGTGSLSGVAPWGLTTVVTEESDGTFRQVYAGMIGGNAFETLAMKPYAGRLITRQDDVRGGPPEGWPVVLSYGFWRDRFGADARVIGSTMRISGKLVRIVGVAPRDFYGVWPGSDPKFYAPLQFFNVVLGRDVLNGPQAFANFPAIGRLKSGSSLEEANAEMKARQPQLLRDFLPPSAATDPFFRNARLTVVSSRTGLPTFFGRTYSTPLYMMQALVAVVLLLCCVNVSGLMMSKIHERQREFAIRAAIGAARWRLVRQHLTESFVIALAGAALGALGAWYGGEFLLTFFRHPNWGTGVRVQPDNMVFAVTACSALLTTLLFGILPAWKSGRSDPGTLMKARTASAERRIGGRAMVPIQVALSLVLVTLATLLSQSLTRLRAEQMGFELDRVTIQTPPFHQLPQKGEAKLDVYQRMVDAIERSPAIRSAAVTSFTPMTGFQAMATFQALREGGGDPVDAKLAYNDVGPGYFRTMRIRIVSGREFAKSERRNDICVLNLSAAHVLFARQDAMGQYVRTNDARFPQAATCRVVGLASDARYANLREAPPPTLYFPISTSRIDQLGNLVFLMNANEKADAVSAYREALAEHAPTIPLVLFATLREQMDAALGSERAITTLSNVFGVLALFLSALGLYGLLSSGVAQRTSEIGVRMAMGARRGTLLWMILADGFRLVGAGMLLGSIGLYFAVGYVAKMLYGVSAFDPVTLAAAVTVLAIVGIAAGLFPALRAASVDPIRALRADS